MQCSTNWAIKPTGSWSSTEIESRRYASEWKKNHKIWNSNETSKVMYSTYLKASYESKGFESMTSVIPGALLYQTRYYSNRGFSSVQFAHGPLNVKLTCKFTWPSCKSSEQRNYLLQRREKLWLRRDFNPSLYIISNYGLFCLFQQMITHLLRTHLFMEPIAVATYRQVPTLHPLYKLLSPHIRGVLAINTLGRDVLIAEGGVADNTLTVGGGGNY